MNTNRINYDEEMIKLCNSLGENKPTLLLHSCCAPCSSYCLEQLVPYFSVTVFYYNPNITESEEYNLRKNEQIRFIEEVYGNKVNFLAGNYRSAEFFIMAEGLEKEPEGGERCRKCYDQRLRKTCEQAKKGGFDYFCSTLSVSPYKNSEWLNEIGFALEKEYGMKYLPNDFKKRAGYKRSVELSQQYGLYRQNYCGCIYSKYADLVKNLEKENNQ